MDEVTVRMHMDIDNIQLHESNENVQGSMWQHKKEQWAAMQFFLEENVL